MSLKASKLGKTYQRREILSAWAVMFMRVSEQRPRPRDLDFPLQLQT